LVGDGPPKNESADEETRVDHCTALGGVASRSASRYPHNNGHLNRHNNGHLKRDNNAHLKRHNNQHLNRRYLRRGNGCDVLQRTHRPEHEWLWIEQRDRVECCVRIEQRDRVEGRVRIERRGWQQHVVHSNLPRFSAGERIVQLINVRDGQKCTARRPPGASHPRPKQERNEARATRRRVCRIDRQIIAARLQSMSMDI